MQGIGGQIYTAAYEDISLVVSETEPISFTTIQKQELVRYLLTHQSAIEKIMAQHSVIPLKFGTFLEGPEEMRRVAKKGYKLFKESFEKLQGKVEFDLVASWTNLQRVLKEIGEIEEVRKFKDTICQRPLEERAQGGIELGKLVKALLDQKAEKITREVIDVLKNKACRLCQHGVLDDQMIFNLAFLIDQSKRSEFEQTLDELDEKYGGSPRAESRGSVNFRLVGPLPPYTFNTVEVKKIAPEELAYAKAVLGIIEEKTPQEIKQAYHTLAQKLHPDKNPDRPNAAHEFEQLKQAFELLFEYSSNGHDLFLIRKRQYDQ